jgi:hypothetical protein
VCAVLSSNLSATPVARDRLLPELAPGRPNVLLLAGVVVTGDL